MSSQKTWSTNTFKKSTRLKISEHDGILPRREQGCNQGDTRNQREVRRCSFLYSFKGQANQVIYDENFQGIVHYIYATQEGFDVPR